MPLLRADQLLRELDLRPVLMDIGASGQPPEIWQDMAPASIYIGFDPDRREIHEDRASRFYRSVIVNEAVTADKGLDEVTFYLTRSPYCSTMLAPNPPAAAHWLECDLFDVDSCATVRATSIDAVLARLEIPRIDWIKLDTQGIDLRLINSLPASVMSRVLAIDTEPGLIEMYQREDLFVDVHRELTAKGFWLSGMQTGGFCRIRRSTLNDIGPHAPAPIDAPYIRQAVRKTPAYFEARYLRTLESLADERVTLQDYLMLWVFALIDEQLGFALDLSIEFERRFGATGHSRRLTSETWRLLRVAHRRHSVGRVSRLARSAVRSLLNRVTGSRRS
jgi:FkbM family methyltransferase